MLCIYYSKDENYRADLLYKKYLISLFTYTHIVKAIKYMSRSKEIAIALNKTNYILIQNIGCLRSNSLQET